MTQILKYKNSSEESVITPILRDCIKYFKEISKRIAQMFRTFSGVALNKIRQDAIKVFQMDIRMMSIRGK